MTRFVTSNRRDHPESTLDMRRPGIIKGAILPVTRRPVDNMVVAPTST